MNAQIQRLVIGIIQTGTATSVIAISVIVAYYIGMNESNAPTAFHYLIGPVYMLTLLYNYNLRKQDGASDTSRSGMGRTTDSRHNGTNICMDGIQVHRTAIVSMDPPDGNAPAGIETTISYNDSKVKEDDDNPSFGAKRVRVAGF
ncbi:hypothetical protein C8R43DRAFT_1115973 [Mycena crocata]|nr:hypothetical protein C8R43DRAFT_1115973 [Mycena crocata]